MSAGNAKKSYPWSETLRQLEEERIVVPSTSTSTRRPFEQLRGDSVRVNYAFGSNKSQKHNSKHKGKRRPRIGIIRSSEAGNLDSMELALQETSRETSSATVSTNSRSPQRSHLEQFEDELVHFRNESPTSYYGRFYGKSTSRVKNTNQDTDSWYERNVHTHSTLTGAEQGSFSRQHYRQQNRNACENNYHQSYSHCDNELPTALSSNPTNPFASTPVNESPDPILSTRRSSASEPWSTPSSYYSEEGNNIISRSAAKATRGYDRRRPSNSSNTTTTTASQDNHNYQNQHDASKSTTSSSHGCSSSGSQQSDPSLYQNDRLGLHMLCQEATSPQDIAWRNALYLLGMQPQSAKEVDQLGRTALHIACTGRGGVSEMQKQTLNESAGSNPDRGRQPQPQPTAPPSFMMRALLIVNPEAVQQTDHDGRLPLHCLAASSADTDSLQLLVEAHPASITARDAMGWTPLHLLLLNDNIHLSVGQIQVLLGMTIPLPSTAAAAATTTRRTSVNYRIRQRTGEHLRLRVEHLDRMVQQNRGDHLPLWQPMKRYHITEEVLNAYPKDVRVCLRKLAKWERKEHRLSQQEQKLQEETGDVYEEAEMDNLHKNENALESSFAVDLLGQRERNPAAMTAPQDRRYPLHMIVCRGMQDIHLQRSLVDPPAEGEKLRSGAPPNQSRPPQHTLIVIVRLLISVYPEALTVRDATGYTPLVLAMLTSYDVLPSQELLELLLGKRTAGYESVPTWVQETSHPIQNMSPIDNLHRGSLTMSAQRYCNPAMVATLDTCQLPLHIAAEEWGDYASLIVTIYESYPGAIHVQDARGRMPLHILLQNYRRIAPHPQIVALLLSERVAQTCTDEGQFPFDLLVACAPYLPTDTKHYNEPISPDGTVAHSDAKKVFQHFFQASLLASSSFDRAGHSVSTRRANVNGFLWRLRTLPPWLRRQACSAPFVQDLLIDEMASPTKCAFILINGFILVLLLVTFRRQMEIFTETNGMTGTSLSRGGAFDGNVEIATPSQRYREGNTLAIYGLSAVFIGFQATFWGLAWSLNEFRHLCLFNVWRWIDFTAAIGAVSTSAIIQEVSAGDVIVVIGAVTTGLLWCSIIGYLSNWWYGMAFFTGSLSKLVRMILWPLVAAAIFLIAFAEMSFTLSQPDCNKSAGVDSVCSLRHSYQILYYIVVGEPILELESLNALSTDTTILVVLFALLMFLLVLCILVVVILVASKGDVETVAVDAYWEPKLAFVLSSQDTRAVLSAGKTGAPEFQGHSLLDRLTSQLEELWEVLTNTLAVNQDKRKFWYLRTRKGCLFADLFVKCAAALILPLWLMLGLVTFGFLWPPQVRELLFRPQHGLATDVKPNEARQFFVSQVAGIRGEVIKMKEMTYEQSNNIYQEIRELKAMMMVSKTQ